MKTFPALDFETANQHRSSVCSIGLVFVESGFDCAKWLVAYCLDNEMALPDFTVHSQNPVGKRNIESLLNNFKNRK